MLAKTKIKVTLLLSAILFIVIKLTFPDADSDKLKMDSFWIRKTHTFKKFDFVVGGDSRIYRGFSVSAMQEKLIDPMEGINLGYSSAGFSDDYMDFLVSKLDVNAKARFLILGITPNSLTFEAFKNDHLKSFQKMKGFEVYKMLYLTDFMMQFAPYRPSDFSKKKEIFNESVNYKSDGWAETSWLKIDTMSAIPSYQRNFEKYKVRENEVNQFFKKINELKSKGITIIAFRPPSSPHMRILEDSISGFNEKYIKEQLVQHDVIWMDFNEKDFKSYDGSHLDAKSAVKFSSILAEKINQLHLNKKK